MIRIILKGYYGFGNLGDDILLLVCSKWIKGIYPNSKLIVATACSRDNYIRKITENAINEVVPLSPEQRAELVIHGGGGTYFDFDSGTHFYRILNWGINKIGVNNFRIILRLFRIFKGWPINHQVTRVALGIGIGEFTKSSKKYFQKASELAGFHLIVTRDQFSYQYLLHKKLNATIIKATDLAFLKEYWLPSYPISTEPRDCNIGFILKYWEKEPSYLKVVYESIKLLKSKGIGISIFLFEQQLDQIITEMFNEFKIHVWRPESMELSDYLGHLKKQDILVTSRAHGAVIGSALGIPSICIGIEPKLKRFHEMLPNSSIYVEVPFSTSTLLESIETGLTMSWEAVNDDFNRNNKVIASCVESINHLLCELMNHKQG